MGRFQGTWKRIVPFLILFVYFSWMISHLFLLHSIIYYILMQDFYHWDAHILYFWQNLVCKIFEHLRVQNHLQIILEHTFNSCCKMQFTSNSWIFLFGKLVKLELRCQLNEPYDSLTMYYKPLKRLKNRFFSWVWSKIFIEAQCCPILQCGLFRSNWPRS